MNSTVKTCFRCGAEKPTSEFYQHKAMADGFLGKCKECTKADARAHRGANLERVKAYDRERGNLPHRVEARRDYAKTEAYRRSHKSSLEKYRSQHPDRASARYALGNAVRDGKVWVAPCCMTPGCMSTQRVQGHHTAYDYPLGVDWLCERCHKAVHRQHREWMRNNTTNTRSTTTCRSST